MPEVSATNVDHSFHVNLDQAQADFYGNVLQVSTGVVQRQWRLLTAGLNTQSYVDLRTGREWIIPVADPRPHPDWRLTLMAEPHTVAEVTSAEARQVIDDPGTSDHLAITIELRYRQTHLLLRYEVRAYPGAPGLWTRVSVRSEVDVNRDELPSYLLGSYGERLNVAAAETARRVAIGYYNDTQHRNHDDLPILRQEVRDQWHDRLETFDWASLLFLERDGAGLGLVKESHKCVNQQGLDTGAFMVKRDSVTVTGLALTPPSYGGSFWLREDRWQTGWATWSVLYDGTEPGRQLAVKQFDRLRYPFRPQRDLYIGANTWGSGGAGNGSRRAATQANVLREIASCADLGIELLQIDDGWQCEPDAEKPFDVDWSPNATRFPDGWKVVREAAAAAGVRMGLWAPWSVDARALIRNYHEGGFRRIKLDFIGLNKRDDLDKLMEKVNTLIAATDRLVGINWDATEEGPRLGYYFGREHGNIYLENRENGPTDSKLARLCHIRYTPRLVLRDAWQLSHYLNLNQIQLTIQNIDRVVGDFSNCREYTHDYCFAIAMMAVPLFFQETHYLDASARQQLRPTIATYKKHRDAINQGFVMPVGDEPDDHAWTGFQSHRQEQAGGYLLLFREVYNSSDQSEIKLHFVEGKRIRFTDASSGESWTATASPEGAVAFTQPKPATYRLLEYKVVSLA